MIKLATMSSVCPDLTIDQTIELMQRLGYQGYEPRVEWNHAAGIEANLTKAERQTIQARFANAGLEICCLATSARMATPDQQERSKHIEDLKTYIDLAADLACPMIRIFGGQRSRDQELAAIVDYVVEGFTQLLDQAAACGVTLLLETHDDWSCSAPVRAVVEQANHPNLKILWDFMHPQRMLEKPTESFQTLGPLTVHTHGHDGIYVDGKMQVCPLGEGFIDHAIPLALLNQSGFNGYFSIEVIHRPGSIHDAEGVLAQYATAFRTIMATAS